jgi:hypothetical protein
VILSPAPQSGQAFYRAAKDNHNTLEWYPTVADIAASGDLGFTSGPWIYTMASSSMQVHGHFVTVWKRDATCRWRAELDGGVSHAPPTSIEPKLSSDQVALVRSDPPPPVFVADDAAGRAIEDFQGTAAEDGFAAGLRTYGRNYDFRFYTGGESPMGVAAATEYLSSHAIAGSWKEDTRGRSADSTIVYSVGELTDSGGRAAQAYAQIWQYDPKVANWGLRILLIIPLPPNAKY